MRGNKSDFGVWKPFGEYASCLASPAFFPDATAPSPSGKTSISTTTFCDLKNRRVFDIRRGKSTTDLATFLTNLKGRERVEVVCIDLSSSYRGIIRRYFPNARIVADRFHVVRIIQYHS